MLVTHLGRGTRFVFESPPEDLIPYELLLQSLERNLRSIRIADGTVDDARGPFPEHLLEPVSAYPLPLSHSSQHYVPRTVSQEHKCTFASVPSHQNVPASTMAALHGSAEVGIGIQSVAHVPSGYAHSSRLAPRAQ